MGDLLLPALTGVYAAVILLAGAALRRTPSGAAPAASTPDIGIIVPARNEEASIGTCLDSLEAQEWPKERLQIVVVDDGSSDGTAAVLARHAARSPVVVPVTLQRTGTTLPGKTGALTAGIARTRGELFLLTDADCTAPPTWTASLAAAYDDPSVDLVAGFTIVEGSGLFERMQALDWIFLVSLAAAGTTAGFPLTAVGTNLSVRRAAYEAAGGYPALPYSVTEDFRLFRAVTREKPRAARYLLCARSAVRTRACGSWGELYRQKKRWFLGGTGMSPLRLALFAPLYLFHLVLVISFVTAPAAALGAAAVKLLCDFFLLRPALRALGRGDLLPLLPLAALYITAYVLVIPPLLAIRPAVRWKGREVRNARAPRTSGGLAG